jgi:hypothetical protein
LKLKAADENADGVDVDEEKGPTNTLATGQPLGPATQVCRVMKM